MMKVRSTVKRNSAYSRLITCSSWPCANEYVAYPSAYSATRNVTVKTKEKTRRHSHELSGSGSCASIFAGGPASVSAIKGKLRRYDGYEHSPKDRATDCRA